MKKCNLPLDSLLKSAALILPEPAENNWSIWNLDFSAD